MIRPRTTVAALGFSAAALVGLVLHEGSSDRANDDPNDIIFL